MNEIEFEKELIETGSLHGHFIFKSGDHANEKFDFDLISKNRQQVSLFHKTAQALGRLISIRFPDCDSVITIGDGANCLADPVSTEVSSQSDDKVRAFQTKKIGTNGFQTIGGNLYLTGKKIVIVDDVYTHGTNIGLLKPVIQKHGGMIIGAAVVLNRSDYPRPIIQTDYGNVPIQSLVFHTIPSWPPAECPTCT